MSEIEFTKIYVRPDNTAVLICPYCSHWKKILADPFRGHKHKLKVKCYCNQTFKVFLEFRRKVRMKTFLRGTNIKHTQKGSKSDIVILDISVIGLAFSSLVAPNFKVGDDLSIEFTLDDKQHTDIIRDVVVRNIRERRIGCEFDIYDEAFFGPIGVYVNS
jgi:hypothetical protein